MSSHTSASDNAFGDFITTTSSPNVIYNIVRTTLPTNEKVFNCPTVPKYTTVEDGTPTGGQFDVSRNFTPGLHAVFHSVGDYSQKEKTIIDNSTIIFELVKHKASIMVEDVTERLIKPHERASLKSMSKLVEFGGRLLNICTSSVGLNAIEVNTIGNVLEVTARDPNQAKGSYKIKALFIPCDDLQNLELGTAPYDDGKFIQMVKCLRSFVPTNATMYYSPFFSAEKVQGWQVAGLLSGYVKQTGNYYQSKVSEPMSLQLARVGEFTPAKTEILIPQGLYFRYISVVTRPLNVQNLTRENLVSFEFVLCDELSSKKLQFTAIGNNDISFTTDIISEEEMCPGCKVDMRLKGRKAALVISNFINYGDELVLLYSINH